MPMEQFQVPTLECDGNRTIGIINGCLFDTGGNEIDLQRALSHLLSTTTPINGLYIIGFDTESYIRADCVNAEVQLIQYSTSGYAILIRKTSGLLESRVVKDFMNNELFEGKRVIFVGAEVVGDVLGVGGAHGALDVTKIYSKLYAEKPTNILSLSLQDIFNKTYNAKWCKDKKTTLSDWSVPRLSRVQLLYAVYDAWTSYALGVHALLHLKNQSWCAIFSTYYMDAQLLAKLVHLNQASDGLESLQRKENVLVKVANVRCFSKNPTTSLEVVCADYASHIRQQSKLQIVIKHPQGEGIILEGSGDVVTGKLAAIKLSTIPAVANTNNRYDKQLLTVLTRNPVRCIIDWWREVEDLYGDYAGGNASVQDKIKGRLNMVTVTFYMEPDKDLLLRKVGDIISDYVRANTVTFDYNLAPTANYKQVAKDQNISNVCNIILQRVLFPWNNAKMKLSAPMIDAIRFFSESLTVNQAAGLTNAFSYPWSLITGPPGTGKTRTISAIASVATACDMRVLIMAPANAASRRVLESIRHTGYENACLLVSMEYFYEWHEGVYNQDDLCSYVHTKCTSNMHDNRSVNQPSARARMTERESYDFRERTQAAHAGKWTKTATEGHLTMDRFPLPDVVIGTFGCVAGALNNPQRGGWSRQVQHLVDIETIDMIIVDESSQLWEGYALTLFKDMARKVKHVVFIGDDNQLPPHGDNEIKNLKSIFEACLYSPFVPKELLNISYRLSILVASIISTNIYKSMLQVQRKVDIDKSVALQLKDIGSRMPSASTARKLLDVFEVNRPYHSVAWVHTDTPCGKSNNKSSSNDLEAKLVAECFAELFLRLRLHNQKGVYRALTAVILTGYIEQKNFIEHYLLAKLTRLCTAADIKQWVSGCVHTVDSFQGQEADIVFVSLTKSQNSGIGFVADHRRANVLLSRAAQFMVIFGDAINFTCRHKSSDTSHLVASFAYNLSANNAMYVVGNNGTTLSSFKLPDSESGNSSSKVVRMLTVQPNASNPAVAVATAPISPNTSAAMPSVSPATAAFADRVILLLTNAGGSIALSQLGAMIPPLERPGKGALLNMIRVIPRVALRQEDNNSWTVSLKASNSNLVIEAIIVFLKKCKNLSVDVSILGSHLRSVLPDHERPSKLTEFVMKYPQYFAVQATGMTGGFIVSLVSKTAPTSPTKSAVVSSTVTDPSTKLVIESITAYVKANNGSVHISPLGGHLRKSLPLTIQPVKLSEFLSNNSNFIVKPIGNSGDSVVSMAVCGSVSPSSFKSGSPVTVVAAAGDGDRLLLISTITAFIKNKEGTADISEIGSYLRKVLPIGILPSKLLPFLIGIPTFKVMATGKTGAYTVSLVPNTVISSPTKAAVVSPTKATVVSPISSVNSRASTSLIPTALVMAKAQSSQPGLAQYLLRVEASKLRANASGSSSSSDAPGAPVVAPPVSVRTAVPVMPVVTTSAVPVPVASVISTSVLNPLPPPKPSPATKPPVPPEQKSGGGSSCVVS